MIHKDLLISIKDYMIDLDKAIVKNAEIEECKRENIKS